MTYATIQDVEKRLTIPEDQEQACQALLEDAAVIIDSYNPKASLDAKRVVSIRMVTRALDTGDIPTGATQGSISALGYSQSWTVGAGSVGELYIGKTEKKLLGVGDKIGARSPLEERTKTCVELL